MLIIECIMEDKKMKENYSNPMSNAIATVWDNLTDASIERAIDILPAIITWTAYSISLIICCALWVYGWVSILEQLFRHLITETIDSMVDGDTYIEKVPLFISTGLFCLLWLPFALLTLPLLVIGFLANCFFEYGIAVKLLMIIILAVIILFFLFFKECMTYITSIF